MAVSEDADWRRRLGPFYGLAVALQFLTRLPMPARLAPGLDDVARSTPWFPVVGLVIGSLLAAVAGVAGVAPWPPAVAALWVLLASLVVTGAFHEDGLADTADGLGASFERSKVLRVMRDSRVGSYGAVALGFSLLARFVLLAAIQPLYWAPALIAAHTLARWSSLPLLQWLPYAREGGHPGAAKPLAGALSSAWLAGISAATLAVVGLAAGRALLALALAAGAMAVTLLAMTYYRQRLGGITGDCLGASNVVTELMALMMFAAFYPALASPWVG